jgi:hypothetical protein
MEEQDLDLGPLVARLSAFGAQPVPDAVQRRQLAALARVRPEALAATPSVVDAVQAGFRRVRIVAAAMVVGLLGASGLAVAGALPDPAQNLAADALGVVGLDVPRGSDACDEASGEASGDASDDESELTADADERCDADRAPGD